MKQFFIFILVLSFYSCSHDNASQPAQHAHNEAFQRYKSTFVEALWKLYPGWAASVGYHAYDSILSVPNNLQREKELAFAKAQLDSLKQFPLASLSDQHKTDLLMLRDFLEASLWNIQTLKSWQWDPSSYNVCGSFSEMLVNTYDSLDTRLRNFYRRMAYVPAYYSAAKENVLNPTIEHSELAIQQNLGGQSVFDAELLSVLETSGLSAEEKQRMMERAKTCLVALNDYVDWLKQLKHENPRSFRLGKELYDKKFEFDIQSGYRAEEIYEKALARKTELHQKMFDITKQLWPRYFEKTSLPNDSLNAIRMMVDRLSLHHVSPDSFQLAIEKQIPELVRFVNAKNLIYLDPSKPLVVRKEPAYMSGLAGASISSPGPYDINGNTYYNVGSLQGWSKERAESYLREYNHYILQILNIHEAIPGHYTQLIYSNNSAMGNDTATLHALKTPPATSGQATMPGLVKAIFGNGAMVEGWAVYSELMMLESGYGAKEGANTADPEMWLMYYKWNLRSTCNTILDYAVHVKNMNREDALSLLTREAFQQQAEAEGKWRRVTLSQVQLCSYFTGFAEILEFREELKKEMGPDFQLKAFHEKFLSYGSAPVKYIKELMRTEYSAGRSNRP